jgi:hypothetical protein
MRTGPMAVVAPPKHRVILTWQAWPKVAERRQTTRTRKKTYLKTE